MPPLRRPIVIAAILAGLVPGLTARAQQELSEHVRKSLARMPEADPPATKKVEVAEAMRSVHPRLLLTRSEFDRLRPWIEKDEIFGRHARGLIEKAHGQKKFTHRMVGRMFNGATPALVVAVYRVPGVVLGHGLSPTEQSTEALKDLLRIMVDEPVWDSGEVESGMGGAAVMFLAGLTFDMIADDLEPAFRQRAAQRLFTAARRMYHLGHLERAITRAKYWQQDPQNNHRWHRNLGLVSCLLAVADEPGIDSAWMLQQVKAEMDFVMKWYPEDGDCHEGVGYSHFGFAHLALAALMMDRVLGTDYTAHPGLHHAWKQVVYSFSPRRGGHLSFGDDKNTPKNNLNKSAAFFLGPRFSRDADAQAAMTWYYEHTVGAEEIEWMMVACYDPTLEPGDLRNLPTHALFHDLGLLYARPSWDEGEPLLMFKCGPYGGHKLNAFRATIEEGDRWINIAHDDPDANTFAMIVNGGLVPHPSIYDMPKATINHNTILVNGKGQRGEGGGWLQPVGGDMTTLSYLTGWKQGDGGRLIIEGEAGNAYEALKRYRRALAWMPGQYVLILDHVQADGEQELSWSAVADHADFADPDAGRAFFQAANGVRLDYQILASEPLKAAIDWHMLRSPKGNEKVQRTSYSHRGDSIRYACLLNPWTLDGLTMTFENGGDAATIVVTGPGFRDTWTWRPADDMTTPSRLVAQRDGQALISLDEQNVAPPRGHRAE